MKQHLIYFPFTVSPSIGDPRLGRGLPQPTVVTTVSFGHEIYLRDLDVSVDVEVTANYQAGSRGSRDKWGPLEPDDPEEMEIIELRDGDTLYEFDELDRAEQDQLIEAAWEAVYR